MDYGGTTNMKSMLVVGRIIRLTDMEFIQHKKVIIKVN